MNHWEIKEEISNLKQAQQYDKALALLFESINYAARKESGAQIYAWTFEQAAIIFRKQKSLNQEIAILETFLSVAPLGIAGYERLKKRYVKLCEKENYEIPKEPFLKRILIIDVETTGFSRWDEIIEFGAVLFEYNQFTDKLTRTTETYHGLRQPKAASMSSEAQKRHKINMRSLRGKKLDAAKINALIKYADMIVAHNASFDKRFTAELFPIAKEKTWYCSMNGVDWDARGFQSKALQHILAHYGIEVAQAHRALDDAKAVYELLGKTDSLTNQTVLSEILYRPLKGEYFDTGPMYKKIEKSLSKSVKIAPQLIDKKTKTKVGCLPTLLLLVSGTVVFLIL